MGQWLEIVAGDSFAVIPRSTVTADSIHRNRTLEKIRQYLEQMEFFVVITNKWTIERW